MTLTALLVNAWITAALFFQTDSVPIWVPLSIILLVVLIFWWGLTRNRIPEEETSAEEHEDDHGEPPVVDESAASASSVAAEDVDGPAPDVEETEPLIDEPVPGMEETEPAVVELVEEPVTPPEPDDLKIIEGIGPKISVILADAGIITFGQLANTDVAELERIVREEAGIRIANPASWPAQAALAASGDWDGLEELQNKLVAGRHRE